MALASGSESCGASRNSSAFRSPSNPRSVADRLSASPYRRGKYTRRLGRNPRVEERRANPGLERRRAVRSGLAASPQWVPSQRNRMNARNYTAMARIPAPPGDVFAFLDGRARLVSHMGKRSLAMGGGSMAVEFNEGQGRDVGSKLRRAGTALGIRVCVEEVVIGRAPPHRKSWGTVGEPGLLVVWPYRMGFVIEDRGQASRLTVFIDCELRRRAQWRWLRGLLGRVYARWCIERMTGDAAEHFAPS